ncbi:uncharacterized protein ndufv3 isoform X2 [Brachyhypopomus gauderio]|uniref:uncharacterized protein ndufv3 isoform X2 n=1 Tax=Brachyhypopomus gauderio TaxID=698409 RepID=UPI0040434ACB
MATSLLKLGRIGSLKCLQQDSWVTLRTPFTAGFCTKAGETKKPAKKTKAPTLEAPDERAALLAFKTTVAFPTRISTKGTEYKGVALDPVVAVGAVALGEAAFTRQAESASTNTDRPDAKGDATEATSTAQASTGGEEPVASTLGSAEPKDQEATSTSSSESDTDSDSDSDSDSDDEKTDKIETVVQPRGKAEEETAPTSTSEESASVKTTPGPEHVSASAGTVKKEAPEVSAEAGFKINEASMAEARHESVDAASGKSVATGGKEPGVKHPEAKVETPLETSQDGAAMKVTPEASTKAPDHPPQVVPRERPEALLKATPEVPPDSPEEGASEAKVEAAPQTLGGTVAEAVATEAGTEASLAEELTDPAPILTDKAEPPAEPEAAPAPEEPVPPPEPEPFDNTTYKNLQHHSYHTFTFADMDVELAQHRLPQPSTGRPSPMH